MKNDARESAARTVAGYTLKNWCYNSYGFGITFALQLQAWIIPKYSRRLRLPEFLLNRHMEVVKLSSLHTFAFIPKWHPWHSFVLEAVSPQGHSADGKNKSMNIPSNPTEIRTGEILAWNSVPHSNTPQCAPFILRIWGLLRDNKERNVNPILSSIRHQNTHCWYPIYIQYLSASAQGDLKVRQESLWHAVLCVCVWKWCRSGTRGKICRVYWFRTVTYLNICTVTVSSMLSCSADVFFNRSVVYGRYAWVQNVTSAFSAEVFFRSLC